MIRVSNLCPLNFSHKASPLEGDHDYVQMFHVNDHVLVQLHSDSPIAIKGRLNGVEHEFGQTEIGGIVFHELTLNNNIWSDGCYTLIIMSGDVFLGESRPFFVSSNDADFEYMTKIVYSHNDSDSNIFMDTLFGGGREFVFRAEGGFKLEEYGFNVENEQFRNEAQELTNLYSIPYTKKTLTVGDNLGVPVWAGRLLNAAFSLSTVMVDDVKYTRSESAAPTLKKIRDDYPLFSFTIDLEESTNDFSSILIPIDESEWILYTGFWRDVGVWMDDQKWID